MTRADIADYFTRLRAAQGAANILLLLLSMVKLWKKKMMIMIMRKKQLLLFLKVSVLLLKNLNLKELRKELNCINKI